MRGRWVSKEWVQDMLWILKVWAILFAVILIILTLLLAHLPGGGWWPPW